jgi:hypothetical protein
MFNVLPVMILAGLLAVFTDLPEQAEQVFGEIILNVQQLATAGDLRSMANMLDGHQLRYRRYPGTQQFPAWLATNFRASRHKKLTHDHWGTPYRYEAFDGGKAYRLTSAGPDGVFGTVDDMLYSGP